MSVHGLCTIHLTALFFSGKLVALQITNCGVRGKDGGSALVSIIKAHSNRRNYGTCMYSPPLLMYEHGVKSGG